MHNNIATRNILLFLRQKNSISKIVQLYVYSNTAILLLLSFSKNILDTNNIHLYLPISFGFLIASKRISILADVIVVVIGSNVKLLSSIFVINELPDLTLCFLYLCENASSKLAKNV